MTEDEIRQRIRDMIDVDYRGQVDFVERLKILDWVASYPGEGYPPSIRVVVAFDLIQNSDD